MCILFKLKRKKNVVNLAPSTFENLCERLKQQKHVYESKDYYCYLVAFYQCSDSIDDGMRMLNFGSNQKRDTKTINTLIEYIPKVINSLMKKPEYLNFKLLMKPQEKIFQPQWLFKEPKELFSINVNINK